MSEKEPTRRIYVQGNYIERQEIKVEKGGILNLGATQQMKHKEVEDEDIRDMIDDLLSEVDASGQRLMEDTAQWYAVFRVLSERCNYPAKLSDFCRLMAQMGYADAVPPCTYNTVKAVHLQQLAVKVELWQQYRKVSEPLAKQCAVAQFLLERLDN